MLYLYFLLTLVLPHICTAVDFFEMERYGVKKGSSWSDSPTYHQEYTLQDLNQQVGFEQLTANNVDEGTVIELASKHFKAFGTDRPAKRRTPNGYCLVAVMWDLEGGKFWASTIPQGPQKEEMIAAAQLNQVNPFGQPIPPPAAAWWNQVNTLVTGVAPKQDADFHAEDGVFFNWESNRGNMNTRVVNGRYTGNLLLGVYGDYQSPARVSNQKEVTPRMWNLCSGGQNPQTGAAGRNPSCQQVAGALNVRIASTNRRRRDVDIDDLTNAADYVGQPPTSADAAAAEAVLEVCTGPTSKQDATACSSLLHPPVTDVAPGQSSITSAPVSSTSVGNASPSCSLQNEDPDQGITIRYCVCDTSTTLPLLSIATTAEATAACAYSTPTPPTTTFSTGFHSTTTKLALCEICSQVVVNEDSCTTIPNCLPQAAQASVTVATSPVHVGTLTGEALYTSVSHALESICPSVTQTDQPTHCTGQAIIDGISVVDDNFLSAAGKIKVTAPLSSYNVTSLRDAMIRSLAESAAKSATGKNCFNQSYSVIDKREESSVFRWFDTMFPRSGSRNSKREDPSDTQKTGTFCNMGKLALVNYYSPYWRLAPEPGATDFLEVQYDNDDAGGEFVCEFLEVLVDALAVIEPEFAVGEVELGEAIGAMCEHLEASNDDE